MPLKHLGFVLCLLAAVGCRAVPTPEPRATPVEPATAWPDAVDLHPVVRWGGPLIVELRAEGVSRRMIVDTGSSVTLWDRSLQTDFGEKAPALSLAEAELIGHRRPYFHDFDPLERVTGTPIDGILGMDVLQHYRFGLDLQNGRLVFLPPNEKVPAPDSAIDLFYTGSVPFIEGSVIGETTSPHWTIIDTGFTGSLRLNKDIYRQVRGDAQELYRGYGVHAKGISRDRFPKILLKAFRWRGQHYEGVIAGRWLGKALGSPNTYHLLGLGFMRRHHVVFDFPNDRIYFQPLETQTPDRWDRSGLSLLTESDAVVVYRVTPQRPADLAGFRAGERIVTINGRVVHAADVLEIRDLLKNPDREFVFELIGPDQSTPRRVVLTTR